ncbi:MAG: guanylate kinase [Xanthomonadales bacterium]|nr:guanylate kinase [Gammaproteobacteria bacterium]NNE06007.1 guanylate kinase [Xanthomonadales bacterium]NNL94712.1 guanylate kinase [Xanthomonadales bacterium]
MNNASTEVKPESGLLFIIAAPSGGGKTSLVNALLATDPKLALSVSHTTREPRRGETSGVQYHFIDHDSFREMVERGEFLEHAMVFGNFYGTHKQALAEQLQQGLDVILEIDWQGAAQVREIFPDSISIFILPPSLDVLRQRLSRRAQDSETVIARRMRDARSEISHWDEFDHLVVNQVFEDALEEIRSIVDSARRGESPRRCDYTDLLAELLGNG